MDLDTSSHNLELTDLFSNIRTKTFNVRVVEQVDSGSELVALLKQTLSRFQPEMLRFDVHSFTDLRQPWELSLDSIDLSMLRVLTIDLSLVYRVMGPLNVSPSSRAFVLPALEEVHISGVMLSGLSHILSSLDRNSFKLISIDLYKEEDTDLNIVEHCETLQRLGVPSFPSIVSASWSLGPGQVSFIRVFSRLVPNAQHLHFTVDLRDSESTSSGFEEQLFSFCN
jgi:hypothetical protein